MTTDSAGTPQSRSGGQPGSLAEWLEYIERVHPSAIAMGLDRVHRVVRSLALDIAFPVFTVGGTNGKGSVCAMLDAILRAAGYRAGCYTSPHLIEYNERVRLGGQQAGDRDLARAFAAVDAARGDIPLTYFEFGTLAALWLFVEQRVDAAVLEVGLGGRLDAVNAFDPDCAVVVSIDLDHMEYLGADRESIGYEKAGIFRAGIPAVCADPSPPASLRRYAAEVGARLLVMGEDFGFEREARQWHYRGPLGRRTALPHPALRGDAQIGNAAAAIAALDSLRDRLPVAMNDVRSGLSQVVLPGRFQVLPGRPAVVLDVAHNPHAARELASNLATLAPGGRVLAVFSMLGDKDIAGVVAALAGRVSHWFVAELEAPRGATRDKLADALGCANAAGSLTPCVSIAEAYSRACDMAAEDDKIVVFGSFYTVAAVMQARDRCVAGLRRRSPR